MVSMVGSGGSEVWPGRTRADGAKGASSLFSQRTAQLLSSFSSTKPLSQRVEKIPQRVITLVLGYAEARLLEPSDNLALGHNGLSEAGHGHRGS